MKARTVKKSRRKTLTKGDSYFRQILRLAMFSSPVCGRLKARRVNSNKIRREPLSWVVLQSDPGVRSIFQEKRERRAEDGTHQLTRIYRQRCNRWAGYTYSALLVQLAMAIMQNSWTRMALGSIYLILRWLGTVWGRTKCANFFVKTYCLWHKQLENEIILGGHRAPFFRKWVRTLLSSTFLSMEWMGKRGLACL